MQFLRSATVTICLFISSKAFAAYTVTTAESFIRNWAAENHSKLLELHKLAAQPLPQNHFYLTFIAKVRWHSGVEAFYELNLYAAPAGSYRTETSSMGHALDKWKRLTPDQYQTLVSKAHQVIGQCGLRF